MDHWIEISVGASVVAIPRSELVIRTARSSGPGGQNVNKVETKVELEFDVIRSPSLTEQQKSLLQERLAGRVNSRGVLRIVAQESRSQWSNREMVVRKFVETLTKALKPRRKRLPTKRSKSSLERRLKRKKIRGETKRLRRTPEE